MTTLPYSCMSIIGTDNRATHNYLIHIAASFNLEPEKEMWIWTAAVNVNMCHIFNIQAFSYKLLLTLKGD